jgi:hypothetical protein
MLLEIAGDAESVIGVAKIRRDAGAGSAAGNFDVVPPGTTTGGSTLTSFRTAGISLWRTGEVRRRIPVATPLVHVLANVVKPKSVRTLLSDRLWTVDPALGIVRPRKRRLIPPRIEL